MLAWKFTYQFLYCSTVVLIVVVIILTVWYDRRAILAGGRVVGRQRLTYTSEGNDIHAVLM